MTGGMTKAKKQMVADIILNMIALTSFGWQFDQVLQIVRSMETEGSTPKDILHWLQDTANKEAKALRDRVASVEEVVPTPAG